MSKNVLIYLLGAWTSISVWMAATGLFLKMSPGWGSFFAFLSLAAWVSTILGLISETVKTLDNEK
jgi:hypothetical protein